MQKEQMRKSINIEEYMIKPSVKVEFSAKKELTFLVSWKVSSLRHSCLDIFSLGCVVVSAVDNMIVKNRTLKVILKPSFILVVYIGISKFHK